MSEKDLVIASTLNIPAIGAQPNKPCYLLSHGIANNKKRSLFLIVGELKTENSFIQVKGLQLDPSLSEEDVITNYQNLLQSTDKSKLVEMWFPWHSIVSIRSLVYKGK